MAQETAGGAGERSKEIDQAFDDLVRSLVPHQWNHPTEQQQTTERALESLRSLLHRHEEILGVLYPEHESPGVD